jgi:hypothetical protein
MRSRLAVLALALLVLTVASPGIEAVAGCLDLCPDETPGQDQCSNDACCSCCFHSGPLFVTMPVPAPSLDPTGAITPPEATPMPPARSSDIQHVPKSPTA